MIDKFPEEQRTFETRLQFISDIFLNLYEPIDIMAHCVSHKLNFSCLQYNEALSKSILNMTGEDPLRVLKKIK